MASPAFGGFPAFAGVGLVAALAHYGLLVALVEAKGLDPVRATLAGYLAGGIVSYLLNRRLTFRSRRLHGEATWRFGLVAVAGFLLTWASMALLVRGLALPYLPAQIATTAVVMIWSFAANKIWTFRHSDVLPPP